MIRLLPVILMSGFVNNTGYSNGFNYKANNCEIHFNMSSFCYDDTYQELQINFYGEFYFNNSEDYMFSFTSVTYSITLNEYSYYGDANLSAWYNEVILYDTDDITFNVVNNIDDLRPDLSISLNGQSSFIYVTYDIENPTLLQMYNDYLNGFNNNSLDFELDFANDSTYVDNLTNLINYGGRSINDGYDFAFQSGFVNGYEDGYSDGRDAGYTIGEQNGFTDGYNQGLADGTLTDETAFTIFSGVLAVGMLPINVFLSIFNFEILGINLSAFVSSLLSVCIVLIVIKRTMAIKED